MRSIVEAATGNNIVTILVEGLQRLKYQGYDSAGLAVSGPGPSSACVQSDGGHTGKRLSQHQGANSIAHTRRATHGVPCGRNTHAHVSGSITVVHNGTIENYESLRSELSAQG